MTERHDAARQYYRIGLPITLCPPGEKKPLGEGWDDKNPGRAWQRKRWDPKEIDRAFKVRGDLNVGILFGPSSGLIDIEEDSREDSRAFAVLVQRLSAPSHFVIQ
jgi:hypothetical protein